MAAKILVVGESNIAARMTDHLRRYGEVTVTTASHFHAVPQGTSWVVILDGGPHAGKILSMAGRAGVKATSVPASWAHAEEKLRRSGFFAALKQPPSSRTYSSEGLTQRPFAHVTDALKERERKEAERKAREATERGINPPPPPPEEPEAPAPATEGVTPPVQEAPLADDRKEGTVQTTPERPRERTQQSIEKELRLQQLFEWNPDLSLADASRILTGISPDGRAIAWNVISDARRRVRKSLGLDPEVRRYSTIDRVNPGSPVELPAPFTQREDAPAPGTQAPPPPPQVAYSIPLPQGVESAARLLQEELERSPEVAAFTLTFKKGERPRVRWRPDIEGDVEL